jgi:hypothetical protein
MSMQIGEEQRMRQRLVAERPASTPRHASITDWEGNNSFGSIGRVHDTMRPVDRLSLDVSPPIAAQTRYMSSNRFVSLLKNKRFRSRV